VSFFANIVIILSLAFLGALFATFVTALLMWGFSQAIDGQLSFISALVFGSLISSTDPVTVLSLLPSNCDRRLYMLIFGESALNDAVAIILYRFFTSLSETDLSVAPFFISVFASAGVFVGSVFVGVSMALIFAKITKHINIQGHEGATFEGVMLLIFAYLSYLLAELLSLTGIIAIFFCGIAMAHYAYNNLAEHTVKTMKVH
jgi:NhaP-type Na+/H+ or K+/H+ antiporter